MKIVKIVGLSLAVLAIVLVLFGLVFDRLVSPRAVVEYPPQGRIVDIDGVQTHVVCSGQGETVVVLFHGFGGGAIDLLPLMEVLQRSFRVCSFDRPGNDYASPMPKGWTIQDALAWQNRVIQSLGISAPLIAGHSLGGAFALAYAAEYPAAGVILLDGLSPEIADTVVARMGSYSGLIFPAWAGLLRPMAGAFISPDYVSFDQDLAEQMKALRSRSRTIVGYAKEGSLAAQGLGTTALHSAVSRLEVPLLLLVSEKTDVPEGTPFTHSLLALKDEYGNSTVVTIPEARHYAIVTHAELIGVSIEQWMMNRL